MPDWISRVGAFIGIGASPAALILGAQLSARHDAPLAAIGVGVGAVGMLALLIWHGRLGAREPVGEGITFGEITLRYFDHRSARLISLVLAMAMVGWVGFNAGLGGASLSALTDMPQAVSSSLLVALVCVLALAGLRWWNWLAIAATTASLVLIVSIVLALDPSDSPISLEVPSPNRFLTDVTALMGYVAVFALRSPDFTVGVRNKSDVVWPSALMVAITVGVAAAGVVVWADSGSGEVIAVVAEQFSAGNALLLLAVVPAMLTSFHSGRLALAAGTQMPLRRAAAVVAAVGLVLGILRFDRHLVVWLGVLSGVLVPIMVPLSAEIHSRRRGRAPRRVPAWCWTPASAAGAVGVLAGWHLALAAAVLLAAALTIGSALRGRPRSLVHQ